MSKTPGLAFPYENARRSLNYLQGAVDPWQGGLPYFWIKFDDSATWFEHNHWDHSENLGRFLYGALFSRRVLGESRELPIERLLKQLIYDSIIPGEAFSFRPDHSPFEEAGEAGHAPVAELLARRPSAMEANLWDNRSVLTGLMLNAKLSGDSRSWEAAAAMVERYKQLAAWEGDTAFLSRINYPTGYHAAAEPPGQKHFGENMGGWITPLVFYYRETGDEAALQLAAGLARAFVRAFPMEVPIQQHLPVPLHMNTHALLYLTAGMVRVYRITGEQILLDWARRQFDAMVASLGSAMGWTAEFMPFQTRQPNDGRENSCETCTLADRIDTAIQLALAGHEEYWNDVFRAAVNYLYEAQFKDNSWMPVDESRADTFFRSYYHVRERMVGAYVGWGGVNDLVHPEARVPRSVQNCCGPHGAFAIHQVWHYAIRGSERGVHLNLPISRDSLWCTVVSHLPVEGRVQVTMKRSGPLFVRVPDWLPSDQMKVSVNGAARAFTPSGCYTRVEVAAGDQVEIEHPLREADTEETINGTCYRLRWRGDFVLGIDPPGQVAPLFTRRPADMVNPPPLDSARGGARLSEVEAPHPRSEWPAPIADLEW